MGNYFWKEKSITSQDNDTHPDISVTHNYEGCDVLYDFVEQGFNCRRSFADEYIYILHYLL